MAATGRAALDDSQFAAILQSDVIQELRPAMTSREFLRQAAPGASRVGQFVLYGDPGPATAPADDITDISSTAMADSNVQVTAAEVGWRIDVSDFAKAITIQGGGLIGDAAAMVARCVAEKWEADLAALMDDFSNVTTTSATLTPVDLLAAYSALEQRDIPGPYVGYVHPKQSGELRAEIATTTASYAVGRDGDLVRPFTDSGFFGTYMGLPIWQTSLTVTTSGLIGGAVFSSKNALGFYEVWGPRIETQRDASLRSLEIVGTQAYGLVEISDTRGQTLKSVA